MFYGRFDKLKFENERSILRDSLCNKKDQSPIITCGNVINSQPTLKSGKAAGADRINGNLLKLCKEPLSPILCILFQQSIDSVCIPVIWKSAKIVTVPKKSPLASNNDYQPAALTSIIMKYFENIMKNLLWQQLNQYTDPYQFAYTSNQCI